jgi:hypothetical protein
VSDSLPPPDQQMPGPSRPSLGPFNTAVLSTLISGGVLIALAAGMKISLVTAFSVIIPGMTFSATLIAVSMGWIFISLGRYKVQPRWVAGAAAFITLTMIELMALTYIIGTTQS